MKKMIEEESDIITYDLAKEIINRLYSGRVRLKKGSNQHETHFMTDERYQLKDKQGDSTNLFAYENTHRCCCGCELDIFRQTLVIEEGGDTINLLRLHKESGRRNSLGESSPKGEFKSWEKKKVNPEFLNIVPESLDELLRINFGL
ncbi:MAG: hypothetical protein QF858_01330 [Candidatus Pacebacteria bacterium]|jgi:hypothetical protein|nr:hypothetical protein [Candidatus Paceibacterota bacterium]